MGEFVEIAGKMHIMHAVEEDGEKIIYFVPYKPLSFANVMEIIPPKIHRLK